MAKRVKTGMAALLAAFSLAATAGEPADGRDRVDEPRLQPGEHWTYRRLNLRTGVETERFRENLLAGVGDRYTLVWTILSSLDERRRDSVTYEFLDGASMDFFDPKASGRHLALQFPLYPGKTWTFKYDYAPQPIFDVNIEQTALVEGWETVRVPAGAFRALKVVHKGAYFAFAGAAYTWSGLVRETYWYAPEAKRVVKMEYQDTQFGGSMWEYLGDELVEYQVKAEQQEARP